MNKKITVIILTYKTNLQTLKNCLNSIDKNINILVIENSKKFKNEKSLITKYKNLKIFCTGSNLGYAKGNNYGLKKITTKYALILNPDTICQKNFFKNINETIKNVKEFHIIGCQYSEKFLDKQAGFFNDNSSIRFNNLTKVDWVRGFSLLVNIKKFKNKKIFDENFFLFFEEFDLCKKTLINGNLIYSSNKLLVKHLGFKGSFASDAKYEIDALKLKNWHYMWSQFYFNKKYEGIFISYIKGLASLLKNSIKILFNIITNNELETIKYKFRFSGLLSSMMAKKSSFRINF